MEHVYKKIEITGSSKDGSDQAIKNAIEKASKTIRNMRWFEIVDVRGQIDDNKINYWQVTLKIGFDVEGQKNQQQGFVPYSQFKV